ncbi:micronuclear linker histone polyprotein-like [Argopecten irradians]|uniref:micronuclear linker histone polyprotein-like n=1 Tax=Argopecten irradians TaxID=31199 RepID=UPI003717B140
MKTEFQKQAKRLEEMLAQRVRNKTQTSTKQSNCHFSMSSDSESEMSDTEVNRIVRQLAVPTDESMDTEGSIKGSPNKPLPDGNCIEEVTVMKELLNKRLDKITEKKTEKNKELKKQEAEAMLQLLNSAVCAKNQIPKGKIGMESKQRQTFSVRALPSKNKLEKKDLKTGTDKLKISKTDQVNSKKLKETCVHSDSTRHKSSKNQEQKTVQPGKCISVTEIKVKNSSQKQVDSANNKKPRQTEVSLSKRTDHGRIQEVKGQISSKFGYRSRSSSCSQSGQSKAEEERNIGKTIEHEKVKEQMSTKSRSRSSSTSLQSGHSKTVANKTSEQDKAKEQMSVKSRSRSSSTSSQSGLNSKYQPSGSKNIGKTGSKLDTHKPSKKTESGDKGCDKLKTFAEKYEESLKLQQKGDLKKSSKPTATSSKKSAPVIVDKSLPLMTDKSLTQKSPHLEDSNVKNPSNKVRARAYSSSEIENTHGVGEEQMNSAPKKAKLDYTVRDEKSNLWSKANATAPKKTVGVIDEKPQNSEKKLSFKIKPTKSLVKKEPLGVNKGGKRLVFKISRFNFP